MGQTQAHMWPGIYSITGDMRGLRLDAITPLADEVLEMPDCPSMAILAEIEKFWASREKYEKHHLLYKRGVLAYGPPGAGKTVMIWRLAAKLIARGGVVVLGADPSGTINALQAIRRIEGEELPLILVYEDLEECVENYGEHSLTALFDGEHQVNNIVVIATTNRIDKLSPRLTCRPSRFDLVVEVGSPSAAARRAYLEAASKRSEVEIGALDQWVADSEGLMLAHLRELVVAVLCLDQPYDLTISRLKKMTAVVAEDEDS